MVAALTRKGFKQLQQDARIRMEAEKALLTDYAALSESSFFGHVASGMAIRIDDLEQEVKVLKEQI